MADDSPGDGPVPVVVLPSEFHRRSILLHGVYCLVPPAILHGGLSLWVIFYQCFGKGHIILKRGTYYLEKGHILFMLSSFEKGENLSGEPLLKDELTIFLDSVRYVFVRSVFETCMG